MSKILCIGDPHFKNSNLIEVEKFIVKITELARQKQPDFIVILGDLLHEHERLFTIPLNKATEFIDKMRNIAPTFILVGNHDMINHKQFLTKNHWLNSFEKVGTM